MKISQVSTRLMPAVTTWRQIPSSARCVALSVISAATAAASERLAKGLMLGDDARELASAALPGARKAPAWQLLTGVANQCLSYDFAILPPELCSPLGEALDSATLVTAKAFLGELSPAAETQLRAGRAKGR